MRGKRTGDFACRGPGCRGRVPKPKRHCDDCRRVMAAQLRAIESVLFPPPPAYQPRVVRVLKDH